MRNRIEMTPEGNELYHAAPDASVEVLALAPRNVRCSPPAKNPLVCFRLRPLLGSRVYRSADGVVEFEPSGEELTALLCAIAAVDQKVSFRTSYKSFETNRTLEAEFCSADNQFQVVRRGERIVLQLKPEEKTRVRQNGEAVEVAPLISEFQALSVVLAIQRPELSVNLICKTKDKPRNRRPWFYRRRRR